MGTQGHFSKRIKATALVAIASIALVASLGIAGSPQVEERPNYPVFPPREALAFSD